MRTLSIIAFFALGISIMAAMYMFATKLKSATVDLRTTTVDGVPCIVANDATGVAISCDWSKKK